MIFQQATKEDIPAITALYRQAIGSEGCTWSLDYPNDEITQGDFQRGDLFCMKTTEGEVIGAISIDDDEVVEGLSHWSKEYTPAAELSRLVVKTNYQNQSIARALLQYGMDELRKRGFCAVHFLVSPNNLKALRSYNKLNFNNCGECYLFEQPWFCYEKQL